MLEPHPSRFKPGDPVSVAAVVEAPATQGVAICHLREGLRCLH